MVLKLNVVNQGLSPNFQVWPRNSYNHGVFRFLAITVFAALLIVLIGGVPHPSLATGISEGASHSSESQVWWESSPAVSNPTSLQILVDMSLDSPILVRAAYDAGGRFGNAKPVDLIFVAKTAVSSVLRI